MATLKNKYFPSGLQWTWAVIGTLLVVFFFLAEKWILFALILISIPAVFSIFSEIRVDTRSGLIKDRKFWFWFPIQNKVYPFKNLRAIRLEKERKGYTKNSGMGGTSGTADFYYYTAYLEYNEDKDVELLTKSEWQSFKGKIYPLADDLALEIYRTF